MRNYLFLLAAATVLAGCPYNPDLGDDPFLCGTTDPKCPDDYTAVNVSATRCECHRSVQGQPDGGATYMCNADPSESNDTQQTATATAIGAGGNTTTYNTLAICPATDKDYFSMNIVKANSMIELDVMYDATRTPPTVDILNGSGVTLHPTLTTGASGHITAIATTPNTGTHYAYITAGMGSVNVEVNYSINMTVTAP